MIRYIVMLENSASKSLQVFTQTNYIFIYSLSKLRLMRLSRNRNEIKIKRFSRTLFKKCHILVDCKSLDYKQSSDYSKLVTKISTRNVVEIIIPIAQMTATKKFDSFMTLVFWSTWYFIYLLIFFFFIKINYLEFEISWPMVCESPRLGKLLRVVFAIEFLMIGFLLFWTMPHA